jgi:hypothetical protein
VTRQPVIRVRPIVIGWRRAGLFDRRACAVQAMWRDGSPRADVSSRSPMATGRALAMAGT